MSCSEVDAYRRISFYKDFSLPQCPSMGTMAYFVVFFSGSSFLARLELMRGVFKDETDVGSSAGACLALWMDIVLYMLFLAMISIWSLTLIIGKDLNVISIILFYVIISILSTSLIKEAVNSGLLTYASWPGANIEVVLK